MRAESIQVRRPVGSARAGFTLLEATLALGIGMIIMFVAAVTVRQTGGVSSRANAVMEVFVTGRAAMDMIERDLTGAFLDAGGNLFIGPETPIQSNSLRFWSTPEAVYGGGGEPLAGAQIYYFVDANNALVRYDVPVDSSAGGFPNVSRKTLIHGVSSLRFQYHDALADPADPNEQVWLTGWNSLTGPSHEYRRLPDVVRVELEVVDRAGFLERPDQNVFCIERLIEVGTRAPAQ